MRRYLPLLITLTIIPAYAQQTMSLGAKLASIDAGQVLPESAPQTARANAALRAASARCTDPPSRMADLAVYIAKEVMKQGNASTTVEVLEGLDAVLVDFTQKLDCVPVLASYAGMRKQGYTHSRVVVMQRALNKVIAEAETQPAKK